MSSKFSLLELSDVKIILNAFSIATFNILERLILSLSPPQPKTTIKLSNYFLIEFKRILKECSLWAKSIIILTGIPSTKSNLPLGSFKKERSLIESSSNLSNPIEQIAKTRLLILNSGKRLHENLYFFLFSSSYP